MNEGTFQIDDIATLQNMPYPFDHLNDQDCTILDTLKPRPTINLQGHEQTETTYTVRIYNRTVAVSPDQLKKKPLGIVEIIVRELVEA